MAFAVIIARLFYLQIISSKYGKMAKSNAILEKPIYPPRGMVFDKHKKVIVNNTLAYDLMVTPA